MLPITSTTGDIEFEEQPSKTYRMDINNLVISGKTDGIEAVKQAMYKILNTERYAYIIYSWNYGIELSKLFGKPMDYVIPELERVITEALLQDDRIERVYDFEFEEDGRKLTVNFNADTIFGTTSQSQMFEV